MTRSARARSPQPPRGARSYTVDNLCEIAALKGSRVTRRLVFDWIEQGLLDRTTVISRGRYGRKGFLPEHQLQLFLTLLQHRRKSPHAKKIWGLLNIPVWAWLWWGDEVVPLRQVKRAVKTWAGVMRRGETMRNALKAARAVAGRLGQAPSPKGGRPLLSVSKLAAVIQQGRLDTEAVADALRPVPATRVHGLKLTGRPEMSGEQVIKLISARHDAIIHLETIGDEQFEAARKYYRQTYPLYLQSVGGSGSLRGNQDQAVVEESLNQACLDLITTLGFLRQGAVTVPKLRQSAGPEPTSSRVARGQAPSRATKRIQGKPRPKR
jgi:hypothetical protein